ncbi:MAG TPA: copper resistance protein CopC [Candidatus Bathyarchaeia archaeon]|nr:copper resistance protein CopC [Candidatus Bathyarchaeia archaeon]
MGARDGSDDTGLLPVARGQRKLTPCLVIAATAMLACSVAPSAWAHAVMLAATPADGSVLEAAPPAVVIEFNEPVTPIMVELRDASGARLALAGAPEARDGVLRAALPPLAPGPYLLSYRVTSLDSHPVGGSLAFAVGTERMLRPRPGDASFALTAARRAVRALHYGALLVAAGAALFALTAPRAAGGGPLPGSRTLIGGAAAVVALTAVAGIGLQGATLLGPDAIVLGAESWRVGLRSTFGASAVVAVGGAIVLTVAALARTGCRADADGPSGTPDAAPGGRARTGRSLGLGLGALALVGSVLLTGHAAVTAPRLVAQPALALHVLAAAFWAGSLATLILAMRAEPAGAALAAVERFSRLATLAVPALVAGALAWSAIEIREPSNLWRSPYGQLALAKIATLAALLVLAVLNRLCWLPAWRHGDARMGCRLRRSIAAELALLGCAVLLTASLSETPPPQAEAAAGAVRIARSEGAVAQVTVTPARVGPNAIEIALAKPDGTPLDAAAVSIEIDNEAAHIEPLVRRPERVSPGRYQLAGGVIPFPGRWTLTLRARVGDFDVVTLRAEIPIR